MRTKLLVALCLWLSGVLVWSTSCALPQLARQEHITSLRILAIRSEPPFVAAGKTITLSALVAYPGQEEISYAWFACPKENQSNGGCANETDAIPLGNTPTVTYEVPSSYYPKNPSQVVLFKGKYLPITLVVKAGSQTETSVKRVVVTPLFGNRNPSFENVALFQGTQTTPLLSPWVVSYGTVCRLVPTLQGNPSESYLTLDTNGKPYTVKEELTFSWYVTHGSLKGGRISEMDKPEKRWQLPSTPQPERGEPRLYVIVRDGRGGVDWSEHSLQLKR